MYKERPPVPVKELLLIRQHLLGACFQLDKFLIWFESLGMSPVLQVLTTFLKKILAISASNREEEWEMEGLEVKILNA